MHKYILVYIFMNQCSLAHLRVERETTYDLITYGWGTPHSSPLCDIRPKRTTFSIPSTSPNSPPNSNLIRSWLKEGEHACRRVWFRDLPPVWVPEIEMDIAESEFHWYHNTPLQSIVVQYTHCMCPTHVLCVCTLSIFFRHVLHI